MDCLGRSLNIDDFVIYADDRNFLSIGKVKKFSNRFVHLKKLDGSDFYKKEMHDPSDLIIVTENEANDFKKLF